MSKVYKVVVTGPFNSGKTVFIHPQLHGFSTIYNLVKNSFIFLSVTVFISYSLSVVTQESVSWMMAAIWALLNLTNNGHREKKE